MKHRSYMSYAISGIVALTLTLPMVTSAEMQDSRSGQLTRSLQIKCKPPKIVFQRPQAGLIRAGNGSTIIVHGDQAYGAVSITSKTPASSSYDMIYVPNSGEMNDPARPIFMRIMGRQIFLDREVSQLKVTDLTGRTVFTGEGVRTASLEGLHSGVYILRCQAEGVPSMVCKFVLR